jgi:hypothetical protein
LLGKTIGIKALKVIEQIMSYSNKYERGSPPVLAGYLIFIITSSFGFWKLFIIKEPLVKVSSKSLKEPTVL